MLRLHVEPFPVVAELVSADDGVAHMVRRYTRFFVPSELVSDVEEFIPTKTTNNKLIRRRRISALLSPTSCGITGGGRL